MEGDGARLYRLKWNDFGDTITATYKNFFLSEEFSDVTLACDGQLLSAHRFVLASCSDYLHTLLRRCPNQPAILILPHVAYGDLKALLQFMYYGEVQIERDRLQPLLKTAEQLRVKGLSDNMESFEMQHLQNTERSEITEDESDLSGMFSARLSEDGELINTDMKSEEMEDSYLDEVEDNSSCGGSGSNDFSNNTPGLIKIAVGERTSNFSTEETVSLMTVWSQSEIQDALRRSKSHRRIYDAISRRLRDDHGVIKGGRKCQTKVANTLQWYRRTKKLGRPVYGQFQELFEICERVIDDQTAIRLEDGRTIPFVSWDGNKAIVGK